MYEDLTPCAYCGDIATSEDHLIPVTNRDRMPNWREITVPACRECNSILGPYPESSVTKRKDYVKGKLRVKYGKLLRVPDWTESELNTLGPLLRSDVEKGLRAKKWARGRISW